jgi:hypothetical protein
MTSSTRTTDLRNSAWLILLGLVAFWPAVGFDFVNWDDLAYVTHNDLITSWSPENLAGIATQTVTRNYAPLTIFSFLIDHTFWGKNPTGYHLTNVLLHLVNGVLVYLLLKQLLQDRLIAWTAAALFLVHPVQIESVAWVSSRKGLLCGVFMLSACMARMRPDVQPKHDGWYIGLLIAALLSKALAVVLPPIILVYDVVVRKVRLSDAVVRQVFPAFFAAVLLLHTMGAQNTVLGGVRGHMELPLWQIVAVDVTILCRYIRMLAWPHDLCVLYDPPTAGSALRVAMGTVAWGVAAVWLWSRRRSHPLAVVAAASFLLLLFPVLNFFRITTLMNDRYLYLPCIPVFAGGMWCLTRFSQLFCSDTRRWYQRRLPWLQRGTAVMLAALCLMATANHLPVWQNSMTLWAHACRQQPEIPVVRIQMAFTLHDLGHVDQAMDVMTTALQQTCPDEGDRRRMEQALEQWKSEAEGNRTARAITTSHR